MKLININFDTIKNIFKPKNKAVHYINPAHDWLVIMTTTTIVFLLILLVGGYCFYGISQGTLFIPKDATQTPLVSSVDRASLTSIMKLYSDRANKLDALKTTPVDLIDPAL